MDVGNIHQYQTTTKQEQQLLWCPVESYTGTTKSKQSYHVKRIKFC